MRAVCAAHCASSPAVAGEFRSRARFALSQISTGAAAGSATTVVGSFTLGAGFTRGPRDVSMRGGAQMPDRVHLIAVSPVHSDSELIGRTGLRRRVRDHASYFPFVGGLRVGFGNLPLCGQATKYGDLVQNHW